MEGLLCMIILLGCLGLSRQDETVYLREVDSAGSMGARQSLPDRRHFPASLQLAFNKRGRTDPVMLTLEENRRLNANAPVYTTVTRNGRHMVEHVADGPLTDVRFYQDKRHGGSFMYKKRCVGSACPLHVEGNFYIDGTNYDISPVVRGGRLATRMSGRHGTQHVLREARLDVDRKYTSYLKADRKFVDDTIIPSPGFQRTVVDDTRIPAPGARRTVVDDAMVPHGAANSSFEELFRRKYGSQLHANRYKRQQNGEALAVEILVVLDEYIWRRYENFDNNDHTIRYRLRERFAHVINGVSMRYESITDFDPSFDIYVTLSGFLIYKPGRSGGPIPSNANIIERAGRRYFDAGKYLDYMKPRASRLSNLPDADHIMAFTGLDLYTGDISDGADVVGLAELGGACTPDKNSINEDEGYFATTTLASHELGHNLGAEHDGAGTSKGCTPDDMFLMTPTVASFSPDEAYTANPWTFSKCSVQAFKKYLNSLGSRNCLKDQGDYFNEAEWDQHQNSLPGERYSLDQQCTLILGDGYKY